MSKQKVMMELPDDLPVMLDAKFVSELLGVHYVTATKMLGDGEIAGTKIGGKWFVPRDKFLAQMGLKN